MAVLYCDGFRETTLAAGGEEKGTRLVLTGEFRGEPPDLRDSRSV
jgi:hypothetical protein